MLGGVRMPWKQNICVLCGFIACVLLAFWFSTVVAMGPAPVRIRASGIVVGTSPVAEHKGECPQGETTEQCLQRRSIIAAEDQARAAEEQANYSLIGVVLLALTLLATLATAIAGSISAKGAKNAATSLVKLERPHLFADVVGVGVKVETTGARTRFELDGQFRYWFWNHGRTTAPLLDIILRYPIEPGINMPTPIRNDEDADREFPTGVVASPQIPYEETENLRAHYGFGGLFDADGTPLTHRLFFMGRVRYGDIFGGTYVVVFCFVFDPIGVRWVQIGDNQRYNYTRKEKTRSDQ
jgi:hypothetical protein